MDKVIIVLLMCLMAAGCAGAPRSPLGRSEPVAEQMNAAKKVVEAMAPSSGVVEKYSPLTGRHYSGTLEYEPGTGVKLLPVEE